MPIRKIEFANGEFYHVYNRGTDKREIFSDQSDFTRFLQSMEEFNGPNPIGSIYEHTYIKKFGGETSKNNSEEKEEPLVKIVAYCLNQNHYHFLLQQVSERGIEKFMQRLGTGYTMYFNKKYERTGALFQGVFKATHVDSNEYLLHVSSYVNLNYRVHGFGGETSKYRASWDEYTRGMCGKKKKNGICDTDPILGQFQNKQDYALFAENSLKGTLERRGFLEEATLLE